MSRTIHIYYRHVPDHAELRSRDPNKRRPNWFSYEACLRNLLATIKSDPNGHKVRLTLMFDGDTNDYLKDFCAKYSTELSGCIDVRLFNAGSDRLSGMITLKYVYSSGLRSNDVVYFLENDYLHQCGWVSKVLELFDSDLKFDYAALYDHPDKYLYEMYSDLTSKVLFSPNHHWRTVPSSCGSFLVQYSTLQEDYDILELGMPDFYFFKALAESRRRVLLTPIPGLSTHCMAGYMSPCVDWESLLY
jgi:hypothetical protein